VGDAEAGSTLAIPVPSNHAAFFLGSTLQRGGTWPFIVTVPVTVFFERLVRLGNV